jgi:hypothetical protein
MPEHLIEAIEMPLVFDQRGAREKIELFEIKGGNAPFHRLHQGQVLAQRNRHLGLTQFREKREEHRLPSGVEIVIAGLDQIKPGHDDFL